LVPTLVPFNFHWYNGAVPPFVAAAVKDTFVPEQIVVDDAAIVMDGVCCAVIVMVTPFDIAVLTDVHAALLVTSQVTTSPFASAPVLYVLVLVPTLKPFTFHW
jgi:hypothetical protein